MPSADKKRIGTIQPKAAPPSRKAVGRSVVERVEARMRRLRDEVLEVVEECLANPVTDEEREGIDPEFEPEDYE